MKRRTLTPVALESLRACIAAARRDEWHRARRHGERASLAALHARGLVIRQAWRGVEGDADAAYEYRAAPAVLAELDRRRQPATSGGTK